MGNNYSHVDEYFCPKLTQELSAFEADKACFEHLVQTVKKQDQKTAYIIFLDATHFGYSLPDHAEHVFEPHAEAIPYFSTVFSQINVAAIKNRYLNTIHALDHLFGSFFQFLKHEKLYDSSLIMFTADHGEEFYEKGQLFHASHLSNEQIKIPFILKTPSGFTSHIGKDQTLSHQQMLPLIKAVLVNENFQDQKFQLSSRFNFSLTPSESVLTSKQAKGLYRLNSKYEMLELIKVFDHEDKPLNQDLYFPEEIYHLGDMSRD